MQILTSVHNPRIRLWRSLSDRKGRASSGLFLVEGVKMTREALDSGFDVEALLLREGSPVPGFFPDHLPVFLLPDSVFSAVCETKTPQGVAAVLHQRTLPIRGHRLIALDGVQDPGNVGTILRTADAAGFEGALLSQSCADVFSPRVVRATMGSIYRIGMEFPENLAASLRNFRELGYAVLSSQLDGDPFFDRTEFRPGYNRPLILVIGSEGNGVSPEVRAEATHRYRLPMRGGAESLNAAVAAGIMMYDLMRT